MSFASDSDLQMSRVWTPGRKPWERAELNPYSLFSQKSRAEAKIEEINMAEKGNSARSACLPLTSAPATLPSHEPGPFCVLQCEISLSARTTLLILLIEGRQVEQVL